MRVSYESLSTARIRLLEKAIAAFYAHGYRALTMATLAEHCGVSRRALYHHFPNKEQVFRASLALNNDKGMDVANDAADAALACGAGAAEVISTWLDMRYGATRREIAASPHGAEVNEAAFRLASDVMIGYARETNRKLGVLVAGLVGQGRLRLRPGVSPEVAARLLADGARGVNQERPPIPEDQLAGRYREIVEAIFYGCAQV